jgi:hypothetical protein
MLNVDMAFVALLKNKYVASAIPRPGRRRKRLVHPQENYGNAETPTPLLALWIALVAIPAAS